ncbi:MAG: hypothetical protein DRR11_13725 [Gammaproteobacteria bacterium]|nr:MAG: hypothetical protein DRR11_13725 [Gammaproteobacteria bacterium]
MRPIFILSIGLLLSVGCAAPVDGNDSGSLKVVDYGIYGPDRNNPELLIQTSKVPAVLGTVFGIRARFFGDSPELYTYKWSFPEMRNPADGRVWTEMIATQELEVGGVYPFLVRINNDWEAVPGDWTIQMLNGERVVLEKTFRVHASPPQYD